MRSSDLIVDVGMCDGADTAFYLAKGFRVVAIEANPALVVRATKRFCRELEEGSLTIIDKAIGPKPGRVQFHRHRFKEDWSSLDSSRWSGDSAAFDTIDVECVTLDSVLREHGIPYYVKIDIEGADMCAIEALGRLEDRPRYVSAEASSRDIVDRLYGLGYSGFKLIDQAEKNRIILPRRAKEGTFVQVAFTDMHSGPFGEETPGPWRSRKEVLEEHDDLVAQGKLTWHDFHARMPRGLFGWKYWFPHREARSRV